MQVEIIAPDKDIYNGEAKALLVPGTDGLLGILDNHAPLISSLKEGKIKLTDEQGKENFFEVKGGTVEVLNNKVIVLAE